MSGFKLCCRPFLNNIQAFCILTLGGISSGCVQFDFERAVAPACSVYIDGYRHILNDHALDPSVGGVDDCVNRLIWRNVDQLEMQLDRNDESSRQVVWLIVAPTASPPAVAAYASILKELGYWPWIIEETGNALILRRSK